MRVPLCKLLQRSPNARYQTAGELATELRGWLGGGFSKGDAAAELKKLKADAGEVADTSFKLQDDTASA